MECYEGRSEEVPEFDDMMSCAFGEHTYYYQRSRVRQVPLCSDVAPTEWFSHCPAPNRTIAIIHHGARSHLKISRVGHLRAPPFFLNLTTIWVYVSEAYRGP